MNHVFFMHGLNMMEHDEPPKNDYHHQKNEQLSHLIQLSVDRPALACGFSSTTLGERNQRFKTWLTPRKFGT